MGNGRRSGLSRGIKDTTAKVKSILGERGKVLFERIPNVMDALRVVNPNYSPWNYEYSENCASCTTAAALQLMGYDVEAMPRDKKWRGFDSVFDYQWTPENFKATADKYVNYSGVPWDENYTNTNRFSASSLDGIKSEITSQMKDWGVRSFAAMNVAWEGGGAHVLIVYQEKHRTTFMDFQTQRMYTVDDWFKSHPSAKLDSIGLYRLDNQSIKKNIKDLHKIVKRRGA